MANNAICALTVDVPAVTAHNPTATRLRSGRAAYVPIMSAAVCADCPEPSVSPDKPSPVGLNKEMTLPELSETLVEPNPGEPTATVLELDELWSFVLKRTNKTLGLDFSVSCHPASRRLCRGREECCHLSKTLAANTRRLSPCSLVQRLPGSVPISHSCRATHCRRQRDWLDCTCQRWNNTLRQRLGRFVRKSLSFSKSDTMHDICLRLFLHDYNCSLALSHD